MKSLDPRIFAGTCLCLAVRTAARAVSRRFDAAFEGLGINNGQFTILMFTSAERPMTIGILADALAMDRTTLTAALKPMVRDKLVVLRANPGDARSRVIRITDRGRALLEKTVPLWQETQSALTRSAAIKNPDKIRQALRAMI